jgi:hypothetical protein
LRVEHLARLRLDDREANDDLPTARASLADSERRLDELRNEARRRTLVAPTDGVIIPAPRLADSTREGTGGGTRLASWSGSLLDRANQGTYVKPGTLLCLVGNPSQLTAVMLVDDVDVKRLKPGQKARLRLDQLPGQVIDGEVIDISRHDARDAESAGRVSADLEQLYAGAVPPQQTGPIYQARIRFAARPESLVIGGRGQAKVAAERITIGRLIARYVSQTFRLPI